MNELQQIIKEFQVVIWFFFAAGFITFGIGLYFYSLIRCNHKNRITRTFNVTPTCEETAEFCQNCGYQLTPFKTDCR